MNLEEFENIRKKLHAGAAYVVVYKAKAWLADGKTEIEKIVTRPCRLGVRYGNLKDKAGKHVNSLPADGQWVIDRFVYIDNKGYKLRITNGAFGKAKSTYYKDGVLIDADKCWHSNRQNCSPVQCVKLENVICIKRKGERL